MFLNLFSCSVILGSSEPQGGNLDRPDPIPDKNQTAKSPDQQAVAVQRINRQTTPDAGKYIVKINLNDLFFLRM
jgi:hypothetical protein